MVQSQGGKTHIMLLKNKGRAAALAMAALLAAAVAGGWHWQNHNIKTSHPKAGWAWGDESAVVLVSDSPLASE
jgi:hypothetical protein